MLANLKRAGIPAKGYDIRPVPGVGSDVQHFCDRLTVLISVVRDAAETDALLFDDQAVINHASQLHTIMICSTLSPNYVKGLRDRVPNRITLIDAPMSGAQVRADAGTLTFMTGGNIEPVTDLLNAMGQTTHHMGAYGAGMTAKVLNNLLAASNTAMTRLVLDWADANGVAESALLDLIASASGQNWFASGFNNIEFARDGYAPDNSIGILVKDVAAALDIGPNDDTSLPKLVQSSLRQLAPRPR
ncbi:3-hydroxyisobutyrate dehydrogenase [Yoonia sediminilitoris]|uniref:3-hydroxyisobutyrate dehydrogenase n=2 Tax=Yoonia sediminilitoris TaxID=1286148 RepID=A0A2T6KK30_9RHOB|nr:3-hydroxyisobutyrate dehydrogenase [Yoonia sediminilitoris]RCW96676.1 3-hydroxyisobutyrate dehydrogenase [Yoonia sediminilitoris]